MIKVRFLPFQAEETDSLIIVESEEQYDESVDFF